MRHFYFPLCLAFCLTLNPGLWAQTPTDTDGDNEPDATDVDDDNDGLIEIRTLTELNNMRHDLAGASYKTSSGDAGSSRGCPSNGCIGYELMADLDFRADSDSQDAWQDDEDDQSDAGWVPVGDINGRRGNAPNYVYPNAFSATFDGNEHTIKNLYVNLKSTADNTHVTAGLFGFVHGGTVKNVRLTGAHMSVSSTTTHAGAISYAGGLVGSVEGSTITNCSATGDVEASSSSSYSLAGGLMGVASDSSTITNCSSAGTVSSSSTSSNSSYVGGLVGYCNFTSGNAEITNCYATGDVASSSANKAQVGGLVGRIDADINTVTVMGCRATGAVSCTALLTSSGGGLIGYTVADSGTVAIADCHATGAVEVVVTADNNEFANVGGLVGSYVSTVRSTFTITNCYATGNAAGTHNGNRSNAAGLVGYAEIKAGTATIRNSYATGNATASSTDSYTNAGGLLGRAYIYPGTGIATIRNCYAMGNATAGNYGYAGGLVGTTNAGNSSFTITNCYATGNVDATTSVEGYIGYDGIIAEGGTVGASYYSGRVTYGVGSTALEVQGDSRYRTTKQLKALVAGGWIQTI